MKLKLFSVTVMAVFFSCTQADEKVVIDESLLSPTNTATPADTLVPINVKQSNSGNVNLTPQNNTLQQPVIQTVPQTINAATTTQTATKQNTVTGVNPAHGEPGHRCDIAVGAPINSKPAKPAALPANVTTNTTKATQNIQPVTPTAPGMNPQHGEPGHRCDIAVGAPLNSKPAATTAPAIVMPAKNDSSKK